MSIQPDLDNPLTGPFWRAASENSLQLPVCNSCNRFVWYPQPSCPDCDGTLSWQAISGNGTLAAFSIVDRPLYPDYGPWAPYVAAIVAIDENPAVRLVSQIVDCEHAALRCDMPLRVVFRQLESASGERYTAPLFTPAD